MFSLRKYFFFLFCLSTCFIRAQQYPWWTQYRGNQSALNPGFCGTKRLVDARINYRNQWTNYEGAPKTYVISLNARILKGKLGVGGFAFKDDIGPFKNFSGSITAAYHLKFKDSEVSVGVQGNYLKQKFVGTAITLRNQQDMAINQYTEDIAGTFDGSFGLVYYNDRFHLGFACNNVAGSQFEFYKNDSLRGSKFVNVPHYNFSAGYNWGDNPDFVFENTVLAVYIPAVPFSFDYTLRMHMKRQLMAGLSFRFGDAIALQLGYTLKESVQIAYSYDFVTSPLRKYQYGSHEVKLVFSSNLGTDKKKRGLDGRFLRQKFQYLL